MKKRVLVKTIIGLFVVLLVHMTLLTTPPVARANFPLSCGHSGNHESPCTITITIDTQTETQYFIRQPIVDHSLTNYTPLITFQKDDTVTLAADGCVQTGGSGDTWKRYVNPSGKNSGSRHGLYHGTVTIPNASPSLAGTPIIDVVSNTYTITAPSQLELGYVDNDYHDNGYWGHDNGNNNQC